MLGLSCAEHNVRRVSNYRHAPHSQLQEKFMIQRLFALALMIAPTLGFAQEAPPAPLETPWGALITFLVFCIAVSVWTVWAVFYNKKDDKSESSNTASSNTASSSPETSKS